MNCKACGGALKAGAKFCSQCGEVVMPAGAPVDAPAPTASRRCPQCGAENPVTAKFCRVDGYRFPIAADAPARVTVETPSRPPPPPGVDAPPVELPGVKCPSCGTINPTGARYCRKDGAPLDQGGAFQRERVPPAAPQPSPASTARKRPELSQPSRSPSVAPEPTPAASPTPRSRKPLLLGGAALLLLLAAGGAGYGYWTGLVGDRPGSVARAITAELQQQGFPSVTVAVDKNWTAAVSGAVVGQEKLNALKGLVGAHSEIRGATFDSLEVRASAKEIQTDVEKALAAKGLAGFGVSVGEDGNVTLTGVADSAAQKSDASETVKDVAGVKGVENRVGTSPAWLQREINAALRNAGFAGVRAQVLGKDVSVVGRVRSEEDRATVVETVVDTGSLLGEVIEPTAIQDNLTVIAQTMAAAPTEQARPEEAAAPAAPLESAPPPPVPVAVGSAPIRGTWVGSVRQVLLTFTANLRVETAAVGAPAGTSVYSADGKSEACQGSLLLVEATPEQYTFEETIGKRGLLCPGGGTIRMVIKGTDAAKVKWFRTATPDKVAVSGQFERR